MQFCTHCGHANAESARFCSSCGTALRQSDLTSALSIPGLSGEQATEPEVDGGSVSPDELKAVDTLTHGSALLIVRRGPNAGSRFLLDEAVTTTGRHPESDIFLDDVTVSRRHAEFVRSDNGFLVRDVGSLNGTYVNRERIDSAELTGGDEVQVGKYRLVYLASGGASGGTG